MKAKQRIKNIIITICCLIVLLFKTSIIVNAAYGDKISLGRGIATANTRYERKVNSSSVFAHCISVEQTSSSSMASCKGIVQGSKTDDGSSAAIPGQSLTYRFENGSKHYMINSVYEDNLHYARIHFRGDKYSDYTIFTLDWGPMATYP